MSKAKKIEAELYRKCLEVVYKEEAKGKGWGAIVMKWYRYEKNSPYSTMNNESLKDFRSQI